MIVPALIAAAFMNGDWLTVVAHARRREGDDDDDDDDGQQQRRQSSCTSFSDEFKAQWFWSMAVGYGIYFTFCGYLEWKYYVNGRGREVEWKCQPKRHLSRELKWNQIKWGCIGLMVTNTVSAAVAAHVSCGGYNKVYVAFDQYPWWWWILQWPVIFVQQDYVTYWIHRLFHSKFLFKHFHSIHHQYLQPTPWSVTAIHPVELVFVQFFLVSPIFIYPVHWLPFYGLALYTYYHGILQHSGIVFKAKWWQPWQPDCMFHDNHHQYCNVNYGFNFYIWDKIHGSMRKVDRYYSERTSSSGSGRSLTGMSYGELCEEVHKRITENPMAYRENINPYSLQNHVCKTIAE